MTLSVLQWSVGSRDSWEQQQRRRALSTSHGRRLGHAGSGMRSSVSWEPRLRHALVRNIHTYVCDWCMCTRTDRQKTYICAVCLHENEPTRDYEEAILPNLSMHWAHATLDRSVGEARGCDSPAHVRFGQPPSQPGCSRWGWTKLRPKPHAVGHLLILPVASLSRLEADIARRPWTRLS